MEEVATPLEKGVKMEEAPTPLEKSAKGRRRWLLWER